MVTYTKLTQTNNATCFKQLYFQHIQANYDIELSKFKWNYTVRTQSTSSQARIKPTITIKERVNLVTMTPVALLLLVL